MYRYLIGFGIGVLLAAWVAVVMLRRHLRHTRAAERRARTAERMAEIGSMTGGLAHEIKNPLSTIGLNAQLLLEGIQESSIEPQERARLMNRTKALRRETDRLSGILQDFLQFAGQVVLDRRPVDVNDMLTELIDFYTPEAERQGVRIRPDFAPSPLMATIDAKMVKQALLNLMLNATQAMARPAAGGVSGGGMSGPVGDLILRTESGEDGDGHAMVRIHVIDTGPGIAPEVQAKIFQPYFTTKAGGSGLGLPTSRRLIQEHGGRLEIYSELGKGTDFTVLLPVEPLAEGTHKPARRIRLAFRADKVRT